MSTRNILNSIGTIIGTLTLDDSATEAQWSACLDPYASASPSGPSMNSQLITSLITATNNVTTSSGTASVVGSMTVTPRSGIYLVDFGATIATTGASATGEFGIYVDDVLLTETRRDISCALTLLGGLVTVSINSIGLGTSTGTQLILNGSQRIDVKFRSTNGGIIGFTERVLRCIKVG